MANATAMIPLSASVQGKAIKIAATATPGTLVHTTGTSATIIDRITLSAYNSDPLEQTITVEFGGTTAPDNTVAIPVPGSSGLTHVFDGNPLLGDGAAALNVRAFASKANVMTAMGWVMRITP